MSFGAYSLDFDPLIAWWVIVAMAAAALLLLGLCFWKRARGAVWRSALLAVLLLILANPSAVQEQRDTLADIAVVVVDRSPSQRIVPRPSQTDVALAELTDALEQLPGTDVRIVETPAQEFGRSDGGTRLFTAARQLLSDVSRERVGALFVISDGQVHDAPERFDELGIDAPLHLLLTGEPDERDRRLMLTNVPSYGIVGQEQTMTVRVDDLPDTGVGSLVTLRIRKDGEEVRSVELPVGEERDVAFTLERRGPTAIEVEVEPGPDELTLVNNHAAAIVNGVRDRLRVLLVSGEPHAGERAWRNILKSDPSVDLVHFTILRPPEKQDGTPIDELSLIAFPTRELFEVKLQEFDLVIFDRYRRRGVLPTLYLENVARYVEEGGALFEASGPSFTTPLSLFRTPLGRVLPAAPTGRVIETGFRPGVSALGQRHPVTAELPGANGADESETPEWGRWFRLIETEAADATVLMTGAEDRPVLALERVGEGRVAQLASDHIWLWSRGFEGGGPQAELIRRIAHWLMKEPDLEEENLRAEVDDRHLVVTRRSLSLDLPELEVELPDGTVRSLTLEPDRPGVARAVMAIEEAGLYRVRDGERMALAAAGPLNPREFHDPRATDAILSPLVRASGGAVVPLHAADQIPSLRKVRADRHRAGSGWLGVVGHGAYVVTGVERLPLLPGLLALLLALGSALFAWYREGR